MELPDLYAVVPAAQEEDLLEEVARERAEERVRRLLGEPDGETETESDTEAEAETGSEPGYPLPQVLGLLEHELGAAVLPVDATSQGCGQDEQDGRRTAP